MSRTYDEITPGLAAWIGEQRLFFVATAPLSGEGHVNCSPKGLDCFRILGPHSVAYLDLTGSGAESIAHVRENGRILFMFCAFNGPPKIVRLHGRARAVTDRSAEWPELRGLFPDYPGSRSVVVAEITRVSDSCGYGVPRFEFLEERDSMVRVAESFGPEGVADYQRRKNGRSIDGLPALESE
jgi:hypothetical protein